MDIIKAADDDNVLTNCILKLSSTIVGVAFSTAELKKTGFIVIVWFDNVKTILPKNPESSLAFALAVNVLLSIAAIDLKNFL